MHFFSNIQNSIRENPYQLQIKRYNVVQLWIVFNYCLSIFPHETFAE